MTIEDRQRFAQFGVIVDNENPTRIRHLDPSLSVPPALPPAGLPRSADLPRTVRTGRSRCLQERGRGRR
jgi:hypothetical protein